MKRRQVLSLIGGATLMPVGVRAQQAEPRRIGVLMNLTAEDAESHTGVAIEHIDRQACKD